MSNVTDTLLAVSGVLGKKSGGGEAVLINKTAIANGTYTASDDNADGYKKFKVMVSNTYEASDEGKVVSSGALVAQTAHAQVTSNGTIDTTLNNSVEVAVSPTLTTKTITENGTYAASSDNSDGYSSVTVAVPGNPNENLVKLNKNTLTDFSDNTITAVRKYMFYQSTALQSVSLPSCTAVGESAFEGCTNLASVSMPLCENGATSAFKGSGIQTIFMPLSDFALSMCANCASLTAAVVGYIGELGFSGCTQLSAMDIKGGKSYSNNFGVMQKNACLNCSNLTTVILRRAAVEKISNVNAFAGTPFGNGGTGGHIYIPKALYDQLGTGTNDYKAATNWSTIDGYGTITWHPIEGSIYETQYADGTPIPTA